MPSLQKLNAEDPIYVNERFGFSFTVQDIIFHYQLVNHTIPWKRIFGNDKQMQQKMIGNNYQRGKLISDYFNVKSHNIRINGEVWPSIQCFWIFLWRPLMSSVRQTRRLFHSINSFTLLIYCFNVYKDDKNNHQRWNQCVENKGESSL